MSESVRSSRRGNGEGSIYKRKSDGKWVGDFTIGWKAGKRVHKVVTGSSRREVRDKLAALQSSKAAGTLSDPSGMTVSQYLDHWLENIARPAIRRTSYVSYRGIVNGHLKPKIGAHRLEKLSAVHLQAMLSGLETDGMKPRRRQMIFSTIRRALNVAVRQHLIPRNVCSAVESPKVEKRAMKTMTAKQAQKLLTETEGTPEHAVYALAVTCGLRQGELFGLRWSDVDLGVGKLSVCQTLIECNGAFHFGPPKSRSGVRSIRLPELAIAALRDHLRMQKDAGLDKAETVFCDSVGGPLRKSNFANRHFKPLLKRLELEGFRFHDLRHTSATLLLAQGVHPKIVQTHLGHSQISLTLDTYSHVLPSMDEDAANKVDAILTPTTNALPKRPKRKGRRRAEETPQVKSRQ